jgi:hypothetical protein
VKIIFVHPILLFYIGLAFLIFFTLDILTNSSNSIFLLVNGQNKQDIIPSCIVKGSINVPPPFLVLHWKLNGECDSTIDYFIHFYDVKAVVPFKDNFLLFLET